MGTEKTKGNGTDPVEKSHKPRKIEFGEEKLKGKNVKEQKHEVPFGEALGV